MSKKGFNQQPDPEPTNFSFVKTDIGVSVLLSDKQANLVNALLDIGLEVVALDDDSFTIGYGPHDVTFCWDDGVFTGFTTTDWGDAQKET